MSLGRSEQMMDLLKELALLKRMDEDQTSGDGADLEIAERESREKRRQEITEQIKSLGGPLA